MLWIHCSEIIPLPPVFIEPEAPLYQGWEIQGESLIFQSIAGGSFVATVCLYLLLWNSSHEKLLQTRIAFVRNCFMTKLAASKLKTYLKKPLCSSKWLKVPVLQNPIRWKHIFNASLVGWIFTFSPKEMVCVCKNGFVCVKQVSIVTCWMKYHWKRLLK